MTRQSLPAILLLGLLYGSTLIVSRFSVGQFAPTTYIWLRLAISTVAFAAIYLVTSRPIPRDRELWKQGIILGVVRPGHPHGRLRRLAAVPVGGGHGPAHHHRPGRHRAVRQLPAARRKAHRRTAAGIGLALSGAALLALRGESGLPDVARADPRGYALVMSAIVLDSLMVVYARKYARDLNTVDLSSVRMGVALLAVAPLSLLLVGFDLSAVTPLGYAGLFYAAAAGTFGGLLLSLWVTQRYGATTLSLSSYVIPVVAAAGGVLLLGETVSTTMLIGMGLIVAGLVLLNRPTAVPVELT